jgi:uncharacterized protein
MKRLDGTSSLRPRGARRASLLLLGFLIWSRCSLVSALDVPPLRGRVNDYAGVMPGQLVQSLESRLAQFERKTGHQVAVLTVPTLEGEDIEGFSIRVADTWKIGKKGFDNGVILVVAIKDRRLRLEVGYGLEGVLPDAIAKRITSEYIVPHFRAQDYAGGILAGIDAVLKVIENEPLPPSARQKSPDRDSAINSFAMLAITLALLAMLALSSIANRRRNRFWSTRGRDYPPILWQGGGFGGGDGGFSGGGGGFGGGGASDSW